MVFQMEVLLYQFLVEHLGYSEDWGTNNPNSLFIGTYNYLVTDTNGCIYNNSVTITEPNVLTSTLIPTDLTSCLVSNGSIDLIVSGGTSPTHIYGIIQMIQLKICLIFPLGIIL